MNFIKFRDAVNAQFNALVKAGELFVVDIDKDTLWDTYINAFPEGTNPMFRERTEHDCSCCKNFIRNIGNVVSINKNGNVSTVWDIALHDGYQDVSEAMRELVVGAPIRGIYRTSERKYGLIKNTEMRDDGSIHTWNHFYADLPRTVVVSGSGESAGRVIGDAQSTYGVLRRSVEDITASAIATVEELIKQKSLYRGQEHLKTVTDLKKVKKAYDKLGTDREKECFLWLKTVELGRYARFKNTVIGTLLDDLSNDVDLETAVSSFETKVAPENYKRTTALITKSMIDNANKKVKELGLEDSLHRRFAKEDDLTINNVLFADRESGLVADATPLDDLLSPTKPTKKPNLDKVQEIGIEDFIKDVLPSAQSLEVMMENRHTSNLVSLVAPVYANSEPLLKWDNGFSWSYNGEVTDSVKERVKKAGGNVVGDVRVSLSWFNYDDLDLHVREPGDHIYFGNKRSRNGGHLDVDMNVGATTREAVENVVYVDKKRMTPGRYSFYVNNYTKRESIDVGFSIQVEVGGEVQNLHYEKAVRGGQDVDVLTLDVSRDGSIKITPVKDMKGGKQSQEVWGVKTEQFNKVRMVMLSPNHWDDNSVGNKHYFFMLEDCLNPDDTRGIFNEFLRPELVEHRKVFEVLGSKMKAEHTDQQLSGVGFSETKNDAILVKVGGSFNRVLKVKF